MLTTTSSGVTWSIVLLVAYNTLQSIVGSLPPTWTIIVNALIAAIGVFVHSAQIASGKVGKSGL